MSDDDTIEKQITHAPRGHILTNAAVWSPDSRWLVYDTRSDPAGDIFDGTTIEMVHVETGEVRVLYESKNGAYCGVVTHHPTRDEVIFILGPEHPTPDWHYNAWHRQGVIVSADRPGVVRNLDARDLVPPFTPGALRGGTHVHVFSPDGRWASFTYEDHILAQLSRASADHDINQRNVGICIPKPVRVPKTNFRNHDGDCFSVLVTRTTANPRPGSDDISRAFEDGWVGAHGYLMPDGSRQKRAIAYQGHVVTEAGATISEVFIVDIPDDVTIEGDGPLCGTETRAPSPPQGCIQRRLTYTAGRKFPGIQGPRHWLRSSPDGCRIAFLMKDDAGIVQLWTVSPNGGHPRQVTHNPWSIASAFNWSPDGKSICHIMDDSVFLTDVNTGRGTRLTRRSPDTRAPRPEACVFSPDGTKIAYVRPAVAGEQTFNQIFCVGWHS